MATIKANKFEVGDKVRCISDDAIGKDYIRKEGVITKMNMELNKEKYPYCVSFHKYNPYGDHELELIAKNKMNRLTPALKETLEKDSQILYEAGFLSESMELTGEGVKSIQAILFAEKKAELVKLAEKILKEEKENK